MDEEIGDDEVVRPDVNDVSGIAGEGVSGVKIGVAPDTIVVGVTFDILNR